MYANIENPESQSRTRDNIRFYSTLSHQGLSSRIRQLDQEPDAECTIVSVLTGIGTFGLAMGLLGGRSFRLLSWISLPLAFAFSMGKWAPPPGILSRWGLRSRKEINEERYALKALRGDFRSVEPPAENESDNLGQRTDRILDAVKS